MTSKENNSNNSNKCFVCEILFPENDLSNKRNNQQLPEHVSYNVLRDEMLESFTRVANARNWALVFAAGVSAFCLNLYLYPPVDVDILLYIQLILVCSMLFIFQFARFAFSAYSDSAEIGIQLLSLEAYNNIHHWNEHLVWGERMARRGINSDNWNYFKQKKFEFSILWIYSDIFYDFYFLINSGFFAVNLLVFAAISCSCYSLIMLITAFILWLFTFLLVIINNQEILYYMKQADKYYKAMTTRQPLTKDVRTLARFFGRS